MKTMIIYASTGDCTGRAVEELSRQLAGEVSINDLRQKQSPSIEAFDRVVIGCSGDRGRIHPRISRFYNDQRKQLAQKEVGLFVCCSRGDAEARRLIQEAFPEDLHQMAKTEAVFRKMVDTGEMGPVKRMLVKRVSRIRENFSSPDFESISRFALRMDRTWSPFLFLV